MASNVDSSSSLSLRRSDQRNKIVVVKANETSFQPSHAAPNPPIKKLFHEQDAQEVHKRGLVTIRNDTRIEFPFNGTDVAVLAVTHSTFPPIPEAFLPKWNCSLDGLPLDPPSQHHQSNIPDDGKYRICDATSLASGPHTLRVDVQIPHLPAFFHSIRYIPQSLTGTDNTFFNNTLMRIDPNDDSLTFDHWHQSDHHDGKPQSSKHPPRELHVNFSGHTLEWYGNGDLKEASFTLDGRQMNQSSIKTPDRDGHHDNGGSVFKIGPLEDGDLRKPHVLAVSAPHDNNLSLDYLLVTAGNPPVVNPHSDQPHSSGPPKAIIAGSIVGGVVGLILLISAIFLIIKRARKRRQQDTWKDSALPSAIEYPASRVSSRSSFSRELVTGDIEYNPEAQKKMDALNDQPVIAEPPAAVVLHADSGLRIRLRTSEVPPRYTQI